MKTSREDDLQSVGKDKTSASGSEPSAADVSELMARYRPLVHSIASRYHGMEFDDLVQEGMLGLLSAARCFDPSQGSSFGSFAALCVERRIISAVSRQQGKHREEISVSQLLPHEEAAFSQGNFPDEDREGNPENLVILQEDFAAWQKQLKVLLSEREQQILRLYLEGYSYQLIAGELKVSVKAVDNGLQRIKRKARDWMESQKNLD